MSGVHSSNIAKSVATVMKAFHFQQASEGHALIPNDIPVAKAAHCVTKPETKLLPKVEPKSHQGAQLTVEGIAPVHRIKSIGGSAWPTSSSTAVPPNSSVQYPPSSLAPQTQQLLPALILPARNITSSDPVRSSNNTPRFNASQMDQRVRGFKWALEDKIILIYLKEEHSVRWPNEIIDTKLGRNFGGGSSTTGIKYIQELSKPEYRIKLDLNRNMAALRKIMKLDLPLMEVAAALRIFIEDGKLPESLGEFTTESHVRADSELPAKPSMPFGPGAFLSKDSMSSTIATTSTTPQASHLSEPSNGTARRMLRRDVTEASYAPSLQLQTSPSSPEPQSSISEITIPDPASQYVSGELRTMRRKSLKHPAPA